MGEEEIKKDYEYRGEDITSREDTFRPQQIDLGGVIKKKFNRRLPRFVVRPLERLICQDEINYVLREYGHYEGMTFVKKLMQYFGVKIEILGEEHLPDNRRALFVCNHPLGALDGICLSHIIGRHYDCDIRYIVNDMLLFLEPFRNIFVPVNTLSGQSRDSVRRVNDALASDLPVITFPAGICSRRIDGKITDLPWKDSFIKQAMRYDRDIVPIYFHGYNSHLFYNIERWRKGLGIKFNIGTVLLPREMFHAKGSNFQIAVGEPFSIHDFKTLALDRQALSRLVREKVYSLAETYHLKRL